MKTCCIPNCRGRPRQNLFHRFPKSDGRLQEWLKVINCPQLDILSLHTIRATRFVCTEHFEGKYLGRTGSLYKHAIPTLCLTEMTVRDESPCHGESSSTRDRTGNELENEQVEPESSTDELTFDDMDFDNDPAKKLSSTMTQKLKTIYKLNAENSKNVSNLKGPRKNYASIREYQQDNDKVSMARAEQPIAKTASTVIIPEVDSIQEQPYTIDDVIIPKTDLFREQPYIINDDVEDILFTYDRRLRLIKEEYKVIFNFRGHVAPVFTSFNNDRNKSINLKDIYKYATYLSDNEIKGVLVNGTSGEGMSMNVQERKMVAEEWEKACKKTQQMLMVQVGGAPLPDVLELATHAESIKVDAILCLPELYIKPKNADELIRYLTLVSKAAPKTPLLYYHIPAFTNVNINMAEFLEKAKDKIDTLVGIKFTSTDLVEGANCLTVNDGKYAIFLGADQLLAAAYTLGFDSAIATTFNIFPQYGYKILNSIRSKVPNLLQAQEKQRSLTLSINTIIQHGDWVPTMKTAMNIISPINVGPVREPMGQVSEEKLKKIQIPI